jgi:hypothetical protein
MQISREKVVAMFVEMGVATADDWSASRMASKIAKLPENVDEETKLEETQETLDALLAALENDESIDIGEEDEKPKGKKAAKPDKAEKPAKAAKKPAAKEEEDDDEDDKEDEDDEEPAEKAEKPKKKGAFPAKAGGEGKPGVIASIIEYLTAATADKPVTKKKIGERLAKRFPDRTIDAMMKTVNIQVPGRLRNDKGLNIQKDEEGKGYWISDKKLKPAAAKPDKEDASAKSKKPAKEEDEGDDD